MKNNPIVKIVGLAALCCGVVGIYFVSCGTKKSTDDTTTSTPADAGTGGALTTGQTKVSTVDTAYGATCDKVTRDVSSCKAAREALGLTGDWLSFSCAVELSLADASKSAVTSYASATYVVLKSVGLPDHLSNYYPTSGNYTFTSNSKSYTGTYSSMYSAYTTTYPNPNTLSQQSYTAYIPINPVATSHATMAMGAVGFAIDGSALFSTLAANTDNIFAEAGSFDKCQGHPEQLGQYHYHTEPYTISYQDTNLIGVMRDGYFVYGRYDNGGTTELDVSSKTSDAYIYGGHTGTAPTTGTGSRFHYHATKHYGCYHRTIGASPTVYADDGNVTVDGTDPCTGPTSGGTKVTAYFVSGHGNGGTFATLPTPTDATAMKNTTAAIRYYYGSVAGDCAACK